MYGKYRTNQAPLGAILVDMRVDNDVDPDGAKTQNPIVPPRGKHYVHHPWGFVPVIKMYKIKTL